MEIIFHVAAACCIIVPTLADCIWNGVPLGAVYNAESVRGFFQWRA